MNKSVPPEPDPLRLRLESLEQQLLALPPPSVPDALPSKLIAAIPATAAPASISVSVTKRWPWMAGIGAIGILVFGLGYAWLTRSNSNTLQKSHANGIATGQLATGRSATASSKAIHDYEQAVRIDPYNADAWFNLAKAQGEMHQSADAISSAQKAIDIARSRNRNALADSIEAWLRDHRAAESGQSPH
jgi:tetratricopeptide (TPR) repeat protein